MSMACNGKECYELVYEAKVINLHDFRIARLYTPSGNEPSGCTTPTESETRELVEYLENFVVKRLSNSKQECPKDCKCIYNGRFSDWSEWMSYSESIEATTNTSRDGIICKWRIRGTVKIRYKKRLGDCFSLSLFSS